MSEINNSNFQVSSLNNLQSIQKVNKEEPTPNTENTEQTQQISDFSNNSAEALGRTMLFKGADDVNNDMKALSNETVLNNSDKLFDLAYDLAVKQGVKNPYEVAASFATTAI